MQSLLVEALDVS